MEIVKELKEHIEASYGPPTRLERDEKSKWVKTKGVAVFPPV